VRIVRSAYPQTVRAETRREICRFATRWSG
jgi:hypothetical protein